MRIVQAAQRGLRVFLEQAEFLGYVGHVWGECALHEPVVEEVPDLEVALFQPGRALLGDEARDERSDRRRKRRERHEHQLEEAIVEPSDVLADLGQVF